MHSKQARKLLTMVTKWEGPPADSSTPDIGQLRGKTKPRNSAFAHLMDALKVGLGV